MGFIQFFFSYLRKPVTFVFIISFKSLSIVSSPKQVLYRLLYQSSTQKKHDLGVFLVLGPKSMVSLEGIKTHSNLTEIMNGAFIDLSKF